MLKVIIVAAGFLSLSLFVNAQGGRTADTSARSGAADSLRNRRSGGIAGNGRLADSLRGGTGAPDAGRPTDPGRAADSAYGGGMGGVGQPGRVPGGRTVDSSQTGNRPDPSGGLTLEQCIDYALKHQPALNQSLINIAVAKATNAINLAGWLPQVNVGGSLTHYITLPTSFVNNSANPGGPPIQQPTGVVNTATPVLSVTQAIFSPSLMYASRSAHPYVEQAEQITDSTRINIVATVSKTFYGLLLTLEQINVLKEDTARLHKNLEDSYHQYVGGIVDETDYDEAAISLNNSKAQLKMATENITPSMPC